MLAFTDSTNQTGDPGFVVGLLAILGLCGYAGWRLIQWVTSGPVRPDPWDEEVAAEIAKEETNPLCHRCLTPHNKQEDFCPNCGATVGAYTNWLPFPYIFSVGDVLRTGTSGQFKRSPLTIIGFFLLGIAEYALFAPVYWFMLLPNLFRQRPAATAPVEPILHK